MAFRNLYEINQPQRFGVPNVAPAPAQSIPRPVVPGPIVQQTQPIGNPQYYKYQQAPGQPMTAAQPWKAGAADEYRGRKAPELSPFMVNMFGSLKNMDVDERAGYLENLAGGIKDQLDRFSLRMARGLPLTATQQNRYNSLKAAFNDIQKYTTDQDFYDAQMKKLGDMTPEQYNANLRNQILERYGMKNKDLPPRG